MSINDFIERLLAHTGITPLSIKVDDGEFFVVQIDVTEEDSGLLIGYHGESLASLQKILHAVFREEIGEKRIIVNVNDYKARREEQLKEMTLRIAERVLESGQNYVFSYLPANERLIVHKTMTETPEFSELESISTGEGKARRLEIRKKQSE